MVKVAIPVTDNLICTQFGACSAYVIYEIDQKTVKSRRTEVPNDMNSAVLLKWIEDLEITDLIVHEIEKTSLHYFSGTKINLFVGVPIRTPEYLIEEYLKGTLQSDSLRIVEK